MVSALISSRDATFDPSDQTAHSFPLPPVGDEAQLERWEPWVRAYVGIQELVSPLHFGPMAQGKGGLQLSYLAQQGSSFVATPVVAIERPSERVFEKQIEQVLGWAELRDDRAAEILAQIDPQYAFWGSVLPLQPQRVKRTLELINIVLQLAVYVEMRFKHELGCWRPYQLSPQVQPLITTPGHGSFPSGHATQAYIVANVLKALLKLDPDQDTALTAQLDRQAARIATNRVVAGVHFPIDSMAGRLLGTTLAEYAVARFTSASSWTERTFDGSKLKGSEDLDPQKQALHTAKRPPYHVIGSASQTPAVSEVLKHLWTKAQDEWKGMPPSRVV